MAVELVRNLVETTLQTAFSAGGTTLSVTSASGFPTTGTFAVAVVTLTGRILFRVDSVSGTTFTGAVEEFDGDAPGGSPVVLVATRRVFERMLQAPASGETLAPSGVSAVDRYGLLWSLVPFVSGDFGAWSGGTVTETIAGGFTNYSLATEAVSHRTKTKAVNTALTYTVCIWPNRFWAADFCDLGACLVETGTNKVVSIALDRDATVSITCRRGTRPSTFTSGVRTSNLPTVPRPIWLRVVYNGTNTIFSYSFDGVNFVQLLSESKTAFFTTAPDQVGLYMINSSGATIDMSVLGWLEQ